MRKFILFAFLGLLYLPQVVHGFTCSSAFSASNPSRTRNLTQIYIHRNSQFPLHVDLIHAALLSDILIHKVSVESPYNIEHIARALNSMHQKYKIPVRMTLGSEPHQLGLRYITIDGIKETVTAMFVSSFSALHNFGYLNQDLTGREQHFWRVYQSYFDSEPVQKVSRLYKQTIAKPNTDFKTLVQIKADYHDYVINGLYQYLVKHLNGGLSHEERWILNNVLIQH